MKKENCKYLTPFKMCIIDNFPFIEADFDAITNYQLLCKVVEYLNKVIANENEQNKAIKEIQDFLNTLDLQDEVDKKLDEMAEDGTLARLINVDVIDNVKANVQRIYDEVKFKPLVYASMYMLDHTTDVIKARILRWKEMGCKGIIVLINFDNDSSLTIRDDLNKAKTLMEYAKENGLEVKTIKFHCPINASISVAKLTTYEDQINATLEVLDASNFGIDRVCIFNELGNVYGASATDEVKSKAVSIINDLHNAGYQVGISCSNLRLGLGRMINYSESICQAVDYFAFNYYQGFPFKKEYTTYEDSIFSWKDAFDPAVDYKMQYPNKNIILSETGCLNNWLNMMDPSNYNLNQYPANGKTYPIYFYGLLNNHNANTLLSEMWLWYDEVMADYDDVIEFFKYYLGGDLYE